ncbi:MAG: HAMP domain-containing protein, partial [Rhizobacter sp.]|nr:HAMP domain-containing protein [Burkholderiales bacterium]
MIATLAPLRTLAGRIALAAAALGLGVMLVVSVLGYIALSRELKLRATDDIEAKRALLQHILSEIPSTAALTYGRHRLDDLLIGHRDLHLAVFDASGSKVIATFSPLARDASPLMLEALTSSRLSDESPMREWTAPSGQRLLVTMGTARFANGESTQIALLQDRQADSLLLSRYARALVIALPLALLIAVVGAWFTARSGLRPLRRFIEVASSISSQSLAGRIDVVGIPFELHELATSFNSMLARIDEGVTRLTQFSGDLAHEMRTPIATLLGRTQVALSQIRDVESLRDTLASNVE